MTVKLFGLGEEDDIAIAKFAVDRGLVGALFGPCHLRACLISVSDLPPSCMRFPACSSTSR